MSAKVVVISPVRGLIRKYRLWLFTLASGVTGFTGMYSYTTRWLVGIPLTMLCIAGWLRVLRVIIEVATLQAQRQIADERGIRPRLGRLARANGELQEIRFVETGEQGVFMPVTVDGEPVAMGRADQFSIDVLGAGQQVTWAYEDSGKGTADGTK